MSIRYDENHRAKAVRLARERRDDDSEWAALKAISRGLGMSAEADKHGGWARTAAEIEHLCTMVASLLPGPS